MTLPSPAYYDPADYYERQEARTCKGCRFEQVITIFGEKHKSCEKNRKHGKRCKLYVERGVDGE